MNLLEKPFVGIIKDSDSVYRGEIAGKNPHGIGEFIFKNGDTYTGEFVHGKIEGFGCYKYKCGITYIGFFTNNKSHGYGVTFRNQTIGLGYWSDDCRTGDCISTDYSKQSTVRQHWNNGILISENLIQYISEIKMLSSLFAKVHPDVFTRACMRHVRNYAFNKIKNYSYRPAKKMKTRRHSHPYAGEQCILCCIKNRNAVSKECGHYFACYECLEKCKDCPICRKKNITPLRLMNC